MSKYPDKLVSRLLIRWDGSETLSPEFLKIMQELNRYREEVFTYAEAMATPPGTLFARANNVNDAAVRTYKGLYWAEVAVDPVAALEDYGEELLLVRLKPTGEGDYEHET